MTYLAKVDPAKERVDLRWRGICCLSYQWRLSEIDERGQPGALFGGLYMYSWSVCLRDCGSDRTDTGPELADPVRIL